MPITSSVSPEAIAAYGEVEQQRMRAAGVAPPGMDPSMDMPPTGELPKEPFLMRFSFLQIFLFICVLALIAAIARAWGRARWSHSATTGPERI